MIGYIQLVFYTEKLGSIKDNNNSRFLHKHTKRDKIVTTPDDEHPYRLIHTVYSSIKHKYQDGPKVFISLTNVYNVYIDDYGNRPTPNDNI